MGLDCWFNHNGWMIRVMPSMNPETGKPLCWAAVSRPGHGPEKRVPGEPFTGGSADKATAAAISAARHYIDRHGDVSSSAFGELAEL